MKKNILAIIGWVLIVFSGSALADAQTGKATTHLVPEVKVEKKPLTPEKKCRSVKWVSTSNEGGTQVSLSALYVAPGCCCDGSGIFVQGMNSGVPITQTTIIKSTIVCE